VASRRGGTTGCSSTRPPRSTATAGPVGFNMGPSPVFEPGLLGPRYTNNSCIECHMLDGRGGARLRRRPDRGLRRPPEHPRPARRGAAAPPAVRRAARHQGRPGRDARGPRGDRVGDRHRDASTTARRTSSAAPPRVHRAALRRDRDQHPGRPRGERPAGPTTARPRSRSASRPCSSGSGCSRPSTMTEILAWADEHDADGDGVSGRPELCRGPRPGGTALGRFGWKAAARPAPADRLGVRHDMGMSSAWSATAPSRSTTRRSTRWSRTSGGWPSRRARTTSTPRRSGQGAVRDRGVRRVPPPGDAHRERRRVRAVPRPGHPAVHGPAAARHGRRASPTGAPSSARAGASGARRRCGASGTSGTCSARRPIRSIPTATRSSRTTCTTGGRGR
jgi:hypothetical protein